MTSRERVSAAISAQKPDRAPLALPFTYYGARTAGVSVRDYYSDLDLVVTSQVALHKRFWTDIVYVPFYPALQLQAWAAEVIFTESGPPVAGTPIILRPEDINNMEQPKLHDCEAMQRCLEVTREMRVRLGEDVPMAASVVSPFALPQMQMKFDHLLQLIDDQPRLFERLLAINEELCVEWTNALLDAGASLVICADWVEGIERLPETVYAQVGYPVLCSYISRIEGPVVLRTNTNPPTLDQIVASGAMAVMPEASDDLPQLKDVGRGCMGVFGGLDVRTMNTMPTDQIKDRVDTILGLIGRDGGFVLCENSDGIPLSVTQETLTAISDAVLAHNIQPL